jgi:hypothetical protein
MPYWTERGNYWSSLCFIYRFKKVGFRPLIEWLLLRPTGLADPDSAYSILALNVPVSLCQSFGGLEPVKGDAKKPRQKQRAITTSQAFRLPAGAEVSNFPSVIPASMTPGINISDALTYMIY